MNGQLQKRALTPSPWMTRSQGWRTARSPRRPIGAKIVSVGVGRLMIVSRLHLAKVLGYVVRNHTGVRKQRMFGVVGSRT
jgi:hypothetical protein